MSTLPKVKKVGVAGAGGIGSHFVAKFYDFGVNRNQFPIMDYDIDVYDDDVVDLKNLLHQNFSDNDLNTMKVDALAARYPVINPIQKFMEPKDFDKYDVIFCGVDSMTFRKDLYEWSWKNPTKGFWIDGRCESRQGCVFNKSVSKAKLEQMLSDSKERTGCLLKYEKENNIAHVLPDIVAGMMVQTYLNYLRGDTKLPEKIFMV